MPSMNHILKKNVTKTMLSMNHFLLVMFYMIGNKRMEIKEMLIFNIQVMIFMNNFLGLLFIWMRGMFPTTRQMYCFCLGDQCNSILQEDRAAYRGSFMRENTLLEATISYDELLRICNEHSQGCYSELRVLSML